MTVEATGLIVPSGELQEALFPEGDLVQLLEGWIARAVGKLASIATENHDAATEHYAYYLAFTHVADRLAAEPNQVTVSSAGQVSKSTGQDRIAYFRRRAQEHLDAFNALIVPSVPNSSKPQSGYLRNQVVF